ncbi:DeoR family transcriptional regulator [Luteimicrobium subarcticum]|uniref:Lactose phosphotransferase system repressor n=1 Tax=Luteimicrobium subarcticum TaxID=620910 RepID=A0A2M8W6S7_9MICO|nr:DeoR family transcriptional regulator [Luteimicrobium subarcticum]
MIIRAVGGGSGVGTTRTIAELAELTGLSPVTIRRDLTELAAQGAVRRVRGGAAPAPTRGTPYPFGLRETEDADAKHALAREAATLVRPGDSVLVDNGTTALAVARELAGVGVTALALSLHAAAALASKPGNQVVVPGGTLRTDDLTFAGAAALEAVRGMRFDVAILGACAADPDSGLTVAEWDDAQVKRAAIAAAQRVVLVATADKFARTAAYRFGTLADLDVVVSTGVPVTVAHEARELGIDVRDVPCA